MPFNTLTNIFTRVANSFASPVDLTAIDEEDADELFDDYDAGLTTALATLNGFGAMGLSIARKAQIPMLKGGLYAGRYDDQRIFLTPGSLSNSNGTELAATLFELMCDASERGVVERTNVAITGATNAIPCVLTVVAHGRVSGERVYPTGVSGMTQINGNVYRCKVLTANTLELRTDAFAPVDSTLFGIFSGSGGTLRANPPGFVTNVGGWLESPSVPAAITGITKANPGVVTAVGHNKPNGTAVLLTGVAGMTDVNNQYYAVAGATADTFQLVDTVSGANVDTSGFGTYTSGGQAKSVPINESDMMFVLLKRTSDGELALCCTTFNAFGGFSPYIPTGWEYVRRINFGVIWHMARGTYWKGFPGLFQNFPDSFVGITGADDSSSYRALNAGDSAGTFTTLSLASFVGDLNRNIRLRFIATLANGAAAGEARVRPGSGFSSSLGTLLCKWDGAAAFAMTKVGVVDLQLDSLRTLEYNTTGDVKLSLFVEGFRFTDPS